VEERVRAGGLLCPGRRVLVLLSSGRDSVCLLGLAVRIAGAPAVAALHVNYGLRALAAEDERHSAELCERLGVPLHVDRPEGRPAGNLQAWARERRYVEAARLARTRDADVAAGHTASDQVETVLYRLAAAPGRRALLGMPAREARLVRPLLEVSREETAAWCAQAGLPWREDASNEDARFARNRVRGGLVPALREVHPGAEANVLRTLALLRDEAAVLEPLVDEAARAPTLAALAALPPALARLVLQRLADRAAGGTGPAVGRHLPAVLALPAAGSAGLDLGGGLRLHSEYGRVRVGAAASPEPPAPAVLPVPGRVPFGDGAVAAQRGAALPLGEGTLDLAALAPPLEVRPWRHGDRMRPLGLGGTRRLQDLFTDRKVPRAERTRLPVVLSGGEPAWIPGVATGEPFRVTARTRDRVRLLWEASP